MSKEMNAVLCEMQLHEYTYTTLVQLDDPKRCEACEKGVHKLYKYIVKIKSEDDIDDVTSFEPARLQNPKQISYDEVEISICSACDDKLDHAADEKRSDTFAKNRKKLTMDTLASINTDVDIPDNPNDPDEMDAFLDELNVVYPSFMKDFFDFGQGLYTLEDGTEDPILQSVYDQVNRGNVPTEKQRHYFTNRTNHYSRQRRQGEDLVLPESNRVDKEIAIKKLEEFNKYSRSFLPSHQNYYVSFNKFYSERGYLTKKQIETIDNIIESIERKT